MDRNQATGLILISLLLILYFQFFGGPPKVPETTSNDSTSQVTQLPLSSQDSLQPVNQSQTIKQSDQFVVPQMAVDSLARDVVIQNPDIEVTFSTRGGTIQRVLLKNYHTYNKDSLILLDKESSHQSLIANNQGQPMDLYRLPYAVDQSQKDDTIQLTFTYLAGENNYIRQTYRLPPAGFKVFYDIETNGFDQLGNSDWQLDWTNNLKSTEKDPVVSRSKTSVNYYQVDGTFDRLGERSSGLKTASPQQVKWVAFKQLFFTASIIADQPFSQTSLSQEVKQGFSDVDKFTSASLTIPADQVNAGSLSYTYFFGPNSYPLLKRTAPEFGQNIYLGWTPVNLVNKWIIIPIFNWLQKFISSYGIIIVILVLIIKLALSPLSYKSYVSMAKMKVLKPEIDALKESTGGDMQKLQQEQMKLYRQVGVNPLSGCIPMVLQMPILFAMFYFFPSSIELRQQPFLWADDLSTYDSVLNLPFSIPLYGSHVSLFVLLMTVSTILYTWSNNQMTTVQGPMKSMSYLMPVVFMFVLNSFPAALSFYYFVSNIITFGQQAVIRKFVHDDKIKGILDENRIKNKGKKKSKFQMRLEQAMKASEESKKKKKK